MPIPRAAARLPPSSFSTHDNATQYSSDTQVDLAALWHDLDITQKPNDCSGGVIAKYGFALYSTTSKSRNPLVGSKAGLFRWRAWRCTAAGQWCRSRLVHHLAPCITATG